MAERVENAPQDNAPRYVTIVCPTCRARLHPDARAKARMIECPDCFVPLRVPALADLPEPRPRPRPVDVGKYDLAESLQEDFGVPDRVRVVCPKCRTGLRARVKDRGREMPCPKCSTAVPVPGRQELARTVAPPPVVFRARPKTRRRSRDDEFDPKADLRTYSAPRRPRWTFLSGIFTFPWHPDVILRWAFLSAGFAAMGLLAVAILWCAIIGGPMFRAAYAFCFPFFWISLWTISYTAACSLAIVEQTAGGNDTMGDWPEPQWTGWLLELMHLLVPALEAGAVAYGVALVVNLAAGHFWTPLLATMYVLFPIVWLSSLEADSTIFPFSVPILKSLGRLWWGWLLFYAEAAVLLVFWPGLLVLGAPWYPFETATATGPILAAVVLIYMRLLGRLAWRITRT